MIRWRPNIVKNRRHSAAVSKLVLFPPFQLRPSNVPDDEAEVVKILSKIYSPPSHLKTQVTSFDDYVTICKNRVFESEGKEQLGQRYISCKDECRTKSTTCEKLHEIFEVKIKSFTEIAEDESYPSFELRDQDYQQEDEKDGEEFVDETKPWSFERCGSFSSLSENEEEPNTTDPYLAHKLYLPYNKIQRPRYFQSTTGNTEDFSVHLPRRPRSPIRKLLPGRFDLKFAYKNWNREKRVSEKRQVLEESKRRISQTITCLSRKSMEPDASLISSVVLQVIYEQVLLTLTNIKIDTDIHTFVNIALIWALSDLDGFDYDSTFDAQLLQPELLRHLDWKQQDIIDVVGGGGMRKLLMGVYRAPFSRIYTNLHRRLPWPYVSPSHERGHTKFYPNVRERIDEKVSRPSREKELVSGYVPDLTCFHLREVLDKSYVAYRRKSKSFVLRPSTSVEKREFFMQLVSLM